MAMDYAAIILAAGRGNRMKSTMPKPLHRLGGRPLLAWVLEASALGGASRQVVVVPPEKGAAGGGHGPTVADLVDSWGEGRKGRVAKAVQDKPGGTGHAVECASEELGGFEGAAIVAFADTPLLRAGTYRSIAEHLESTGAAVACLGFRPDDATGYGRLVTGKKGELLRIVEEKDAGPEEKAIGLANAGLMAIRLPLGFDLLAGLDAGNAQGEKYLTDIVAAARAGGHGVATLEADTAEVMGINDRRDLGFAEAELQRRFRLAAMESGATLVAPETVFLHHDTVLEEDVVVEPHVVFGPGVRLGSGTEVRAFSHLEGVTTGPCCVIGPYARLRPGTELGGGVKIGNFVETKNTRMGDLSKANHLSYIGDSEVGGEANIGAGTITCNYDGVSKHRTRIGDGAFIGSNTALVAPVSVGDRAMVGAGSVVTRDVGPAALAVTRPKQENIEGGADRFRGSRKKKAE